MMNAPQPANGEAMPVTMTALVARHFAFAAAYGAADFGRDPVAGERAFLATADTAAAATLTSNPPAVTCVPDLMAALSFLDDISQDAPGHRRIIGSCRAFLDRMGSSKTVPDAELVRLGAELEAVWAVQDEAEDRGDDPAFEAAHADCTELASRIIALPAAGMDGLRVKARVVSWCHSGEPFGDESFASDTLDMRMTSSLLRDVLGTAPRP